MRRSICFAVLLSASACDPGSSSPRSAAPIAESDFCSRFAEAECASIVRCCAAISVTVSDERCIARYSAGCRSDGDRARAAGLQYEPQAAGDCVSATTSSVVECKQAAFGDPATTAGRRACSHVYVGTIVDGGPCTTSEQCAEADAATVSCDERRCVVRALPEVGQECGTIGGADCEASSVCNPADRKCVALPSAGSPCHGASGLCASGSYCDAANVCQPQKPLGASCTKASECTAVCTDGRCALLPLVGDEQCKQIASGMP